MPRVLTPVAPSRQGGSFDFHSISSIALSCPCEDLLKFVRSHYFQLRIRAVLRPLVAAPATKFRHVTKPVSLQMIVGNLRHQFGSQRFPRQIFAAAPSAFSSRHPRRAIRSFCFSPLSPRVPGQRILAPRRQKLHELAPLFCRKSR